MIQGSDEGAAGVQGARLVFHGRGRPLQGIRAHLGSGLLPPQQICVPSQHVSGEATGLAPKQSALRTHLLLQIQRNRKCERELREHQFGGGGARADRHRAGEGTDQLMLPTHIEKPDLSIY